MDVHGISLTDYMLVSHSKDLNTLGCDPVGFMFHTPTPPVLPALSSKRVRHAEWLIGIAGSIP